MFGASEETSKILNQLAQRSNRDIGVSECKVSEEYDQAIELLIKLQSWNYDDAYAAIVRWKNENFPQYSIAKYTVWGRIIHAHEDFLMSIPARSSKSSTRIGYIRIPDPELFTFVKMNL